MVEITAIRGPADERALEAEGAHGSLQFVRRRLGIGQREVCKTRVTGRVSGHFGGERVVGLLRPAHPFRGRQKVGSWSGQGKNLHGEPGGIQRLEAVVSVGQLIQHARRAKGLIPREKSARGGGGGPGDPRHERGDVEVLLDSDDA